MDDKQKKDSLKINISAEDMTDILFAKYLRSTKEGIKGSVFKSVSACYHSIAIAECTESTKAQRDAALYQCLSLLGHQMTHLMDYHYRLDGTLVAPGSLSTVAVNGGVGWQSPPLAISTGSIASLPLSPPPAAKIAQAIESVSAVLPPVEIAWEDIDPYELSDEEREAHYAKMPRMNPIILPND